MRQVPKDRWTDRLADEINRTINHIVQEHTLTYDEVIGVLERIKMDLYNDNRKINDEEE